MHFKVLPWLWLCACALLISLNGFCWPKRIIHGCGITGWKGRRTIVENQQRLFAWFTKNKRKKLSCSARTSRSRSEWVSEWVYNLSPWPPLQVPPGLTLALTFSFRFSTAHTERGIGGLGEGINAQVYGSCHCVSPRIEKPTHAGYCAGFKPLWFSVSNKCDLAHKVLY